MSIQGLDYRKTTVIHEIRVREIRMREGQLSALRCPANRSQLKGVHFEIMRAIGRKAYEDAVYCPVNPVEYASESAYLNAAWAFAMWKMRQFYKTTVKRKEVRF